eukprot:gene26905-4520_t
MQFSARAPLPEDSLDGQAIALGRSWALEASSLLSRPKDCAAEVIALGESKLVVAMDAWIEWAKPWASGPKEGCPLSSEGWNQMLDTGAFALTADVLNRFRIRSLPRVVPDFKDHSKGRGTRGGGGTSKERGPAPEGGPAPEEERGGLPSEGGPEPGVEGGALPIEGGPAPGDDAAASEDSLGSSEIRGVVFEPGVVVVSAVHSRCIQAVSLMVTAAHGGAAPEEGGVRRRLLEQVVDQVCNGYLLMMADLVSDLVPALHQEPCILLDQPQATSNGYLLMMADLVSDLVPALHQEPCIL